MAVELDYGEEHDAASCQLSYVHDGHVSCLHFVCTRQGQLYSQSQVYRGPLHTNTKVVEKNKHGRYNRYQA